MNDMDTVREERGDVKCEGCGCWTTTYHLTLDECYLCIACADAAPSASPADVAAYFGFGSAEHRAALAAREGVK